MISSTLGAPDPRALLGRVFGLLPRPLRWRIERWRWQKAYGRPYPLAEHYLNGLKGIEIGGAAHNHFVDAINVDRAAEPHPAYIEEQLRLAGRVARIDLVAFGDDLPFKDKAVDFVLASHVIEHFYDPIKALREWERVARSYIFLIVPHHERTFRLRAAVDAGIGARRAPCARAARSTRSAIGLSGIFRASSRCARSSASTSSRPRTPTRASATDSRL